MTANQRMQESPKSKFALTPAKQAAFEQLRRKMTGGDEGPPRIPRRPDPQAGPLSFAQRRLWFLHQLEPENRAYHVPWAVRLKGELKVSALEDSLGEIVRRHESLRTTFKEGQGQPVQVILPPRPIRLSLVDVGTLPEAERLPRALEAASAEASRPFDLTRGPVLRPALIRLDAGDHLLLVVVHHIASDAWSLEVLAKELGTLYAAFAGGRPSPLSELPIQYADYAHWQLQWMHGDRLAKQLDYWKKRLAGLAPLALPTDRPRPPVRSHAGGRPRVILSDDLRAGLRRLSGREGATLFMTLLAAFHALLQRYTHQDDIAVGSPFANRSRSELEGLIGFFVNTLVLRTDLSGNPSFRDLLRRVRQATLEAYEHQDLPFEKLVEELQPERALNRTPLVQVTFVFESNVTPALVLPGLQARPELIDTRTAKFDLTLIVTELADGLRVQAEYSADLFDPVTMDRLLGHYGTLLEGIVANPDGRIQELPLLTEADHKQLLEQWNDTRQEFPMDVLLHGLFEDQVQRTPDAVAVIFEDRTLTYRELNQRANQLARHLRKLGIGPDVLVGLFLERSLEMVVGLFGVLKAGGAYVPLDPGYPAERLAFMMEDAVIPVLLTQADLVDAVPKSSAKVLALDRDWPSIALEGNRNLSAGTTAANVAYVIYTSGSTGRPKGAAIPHRAICNHMLWMQRVYPLTTVDSVLQKTPFSFDASVWEFYAALLVGGRLVMARPGGHRDGGYLARTIQDHNITTLRLVPSLLRVLLEEPEFENCKSLRRVFCGGEALAVVLQESFFTCCPTASLHNMYGPTEAAIVSTSWTCRRDGGLSTVPIGCPVDNAQTYVVDRHFQLVPRGVMGELLIGGVGLARGYVNRPALTAEKFVPDPFGQESGGRLYRSGDLARYLPNGTIEYLGRIDHQVKIRGFRIELGEIEAVLQQHAAVREAVVVAREEAPGANRLVAYLVSEQKPAPTVSELRSFMLKSLPEYMVPAVFVLLEALPLTPNGKVDRRALPAPSEDRPEVEDRYVGPRNSTEEVLAGIWSEVLRVARVGVEDNFFELGGHSLLATQIISRIRDHFRVELPLRVFFERPTVAGLAEIVDRQAGRPAGDLAHGSEPIRPMPGAEEIESLSVAEVKARLLELARGRTGRTP